MRQRAMRVAEAIKVEVGEMLLQHLKDPRIGFASITEVEVTNDLSKATLFFSVLGSEEEKKTTLEGLKSSKGTIRSRLGQKLSLRNTPQIEIALDDSIARGNHLLELMKAMESEENREEPPSGE